MRYGLSSLIGTPKPMKELSTAPFAVRTPEGRNLRVLGSRPDIAAGLKSGALVPSKAPKPVRPVEGAAAARDPQAVFQRAREAVARAEALLAR